MLTKKNIVLNSVNQTEEKALLSMECDGELLNGKIRLYNFSDEPNGIITLGFYTNGKVIKAGLTKKDTMLYTFQTDLNEIPENFSCAVINFVESQPSPLLYGNSQGFASKEEIYEKVIDKLQDTNSMKEVEDTLDAFDIDYDEETKEEINNEIDKVMGQSCQDMNCDECVFKKFYYNQINDMSFDDDEEQEEEEKKENFFDEMKPHIDKLFKDNPNDEYLEKILPNSKFVRVQLDDDNYYVLGLIYDDDQIAYICYGVPGFYQNTPPRELSGYPIWVPIDKDKEKDFGYWLSYQDAQSGESVKAVIE